MEFDIYKVTLSDAKVEIEKAIRLVVLNDIQAKNFCIDHEFVTDSFKEVYFPVKL